MSNLIDQDKAIESVENIVCSMSVCMSMEECKGMKRMQNRVIEVLTDLPSAQPDKDALEDAYAHGWTDAESKYRKMMDEQPEIIRCENCKLFGDPKCMMHWEDYDCAEPDGFCHMAERRTDETQNT